LFVGRVSGFASWFLSFSGGDWVLSVDWCRLVGNRMGSSCGLLRVRIKHGCLCSDSVRTAEALWYTGVEFRILLY
jgi:hypothetical protein